MEETRAHAYRAGATIARQRIEKDAPLDAEALRAVRASDVVVVQGCYDHVVFGQWSVERLSKDRPTTDAEARPVGQELAVPPE